MQDHQMKPCHLNHAENILSASPEYPGHMLPW